MWPWPMSRWIVCTSTPASNRWVAKAWRKRVDAALLGDAGACLSRAVDALRGDDRDRPFLAAVALADEQPVLGPVAEPVAAQLGEQSLGKQRVAVLGPLALLDADRHAGGVDVAELQVTQLRDAQPRAVGGHEHRPVLGVLARREQPRDLFAREDLRQLLRLLRTRQRELGRTSFKGDPVEELKRAGGDVAAARRELALGEQVQKIALGLFRADPIGRTAEVLRQRCDRTDVRFACAFGHATNREIIFQLFAQRAHRVSPQVTAGTSPPDHADTHAREARRAAAFQSHLTSKNFSER